MERSRIAIIIPALNEAGTIASVVAQVGAYGVPIVVDDGSKDATSELAKQAGAQVVKHPVNQGYDNALNTGFARAAELGCEYVITIDADGQHNPELLRDYIQQLDNGYDLVLGVRHRFQRIGEMIFSWVTRILWSVSDPLCGMKGYKTTLYSANGHFDSFQSIGTELSIQSIRKGCKFVQVPMVTRDRLDTPRFARKLTANFKILRAMCILVFLRPIKN